MQNPLIESKLQMCSTMYNAAPIGFFLLLLLQEVCGAPGSSVVVMIAGTCDDGCGGTAVNLHIGAFEQIAGLKQGTMDIRLRQVWESKGGNGTLKIHFKIQ